MTQVQANLAGPHPSQLSQAERTRDAALVWIGSLLILLSTISIAPLNRTQEARVLESAREMLGNGFSAWMIPHANGIVRLQKPPLAYWMAAGAFEILGVNTWTGRLPMALCGWLTVGVTFSIARRLFNARIAFLTAWILLGSFLFYRLARLAETDVLVTLALTIAIACILRGMEIGAGDLRWFALSGIAIGFAGIAKGPPAGFAILFLLGIVIANRNWRGLLRWTISGAPIIALLIALPWWIYAKSRPEGAIVSNELSVVLEGRDHPGKWYEYFGLLAKATLPWTPILIVALIAGIIRARRSRGIIVLLIWIGSILIPLCLVPNKQEHYLLPVMPPLAMLSGWWLASVVELDEKSLARRLVKPIVIASSIALALAAMALPIAAHRLRAATLPIDFVSAILLLIVGLSIIRLAMKRDSLQLLRAFSIGLALVMALLAGVWYPSLQSNSPRVIAQKVRALGLEIGVDSYCFYGPNLSLPLVFELRTIVPQALTADDLTDQIRATGDKLIVIAQTKSDLSPPPIPANLSRAIQIDMKEQRIEIYRTK